MSIEVFPSGATLSGGDSQSFEARQNGQIVDGVQWSIIPPYKGKIDASTGTYHSPYPPIFFSKEVTVVARLESAPKEYGTASIQLSAAHTWIVAIIAYMIVWAAILTYWGHGAWCKVFEPTGLAARTEPARPPGPSGSTASSSPEPSGAAGASGTAAPGM
jgi:hypothetical protein